MKNLRSLIVCLCFSCLPVVAIAQNWFQSYALVIHQEGYPSKELYYYYHPGPCLDYAEVLNARHLIVWYTCERKKKEN